jgi:polar amino acid transport system permease protein
LLRAWHRQSYVAILQFALLTGVLLWLVAQGAESMGYNWQWYRVPRYLYRIRDGELIWGPLMRGLFATIELSSISFVLTVIVGLGTALLRLSSSPVGRGLARCYLELIRNTPILVQLYLFYFVLAPILGVDRWWTAILCLAVFEGSFASEIFRAGILSVPRGQWEAADSLGLARRDAYRFVILPQAVRLMLPPLTSLAVSLIKHSSIVSVIAVAELTTEGRNIISETYMSFEIWFTVAALYLALTVTLSLFATYLEHRLHAPT